MTENEAKALLARYAAGKCTEREKALLETWYARQSGQKPDGLDEAARLADMSELRARLLEETGIPERTGLIRHLPRIAAAASLLIFLTAGTYFILHKRQQQQTAHTIKNDIKPGSNQAVLTLADGKKIVITGAASGRIATQAGMVINKTAGGNLNYRKANSGTVSEPVLNTLSTQMGGETSLTLADGTEVKLDAASSITYPVAFTGKDRRVSITGQAYFRVKHNAKQPFLVTAGSQSIQDIGTEFNISSYTDTRTTLIEGSISINNNLLVPGQQATTQNNKLVIAEGDPEEAAAWAKGYFRFNNENIHAIMDKIKRWYNIEVAYSPGVTAEGITGTASRYKNISQVFYMLSYTQKVHFKIEGRRVTVLK
jgi:transmembrane sensor